MQAIVLNEPQGSLTLQSVPLPTPQSGQVLIKIAAAALNPVDWKMIKYNFLIQSFPAILGCEASGTIAALGPNVTNFAIGDAVFGFTPLGQTGFGVFGQYALADIRTLAKKPSQLSFEQASTIGVGALTAALGLFHGFDITPPQPNQPITSLGQNLLVWGASSAVGVYVVQLAKLSGFTVTGVCSSHNFDYVKSLGADHVVDYKSSSILDDLKQLGPFNYAYDVIGDASADTCAQILALDGHLASCATSQTYKPPTQVKFHSVFLGITFITYGVELTKASEYLALVQGYFEHNQIKPLNVTRLDGLESIVHGLSLLEQGKVSASKVVVVPEH